MDIRSISRSDSWLALQKRGILSGAAWDVCPECGGLFPTKQGIFSAAGNHILWSEENFTQNVSYCYDNYG